MPHPETSVPSGVSLHSQVLHRLGEMIVSGRLPGGHQISPEAIGEQFGASRSVVREALRTLQAKGLVHPKQRTGTRVLPVDDWNLLDPDVIAWRTRGPDRVRQLTELMELRRAIEVAAAREGSARTSADELVGLRAAVVQMREAAAAHDQDAFTSADIVFHRHLLKASGNLLFLQFEEPFSALLRARQELRTLPEHIGHAAIDQHSAVVDAMAAADADAAGAAASALIDISRAELFALLS